MLPINRFAVVAPDGIFFGRNYFPHPPNMMQPHSLAYLGVPSTSPVLATQRVAISQKTHTRLKNFTAKRFRGVGSMSKLGGIVLDNYLCHMERAYFGRAKALCCVAIPKAARNFDAVLFDMDGVLCNSERASRGAAVAVFREYYGLVVQPEDFAPFTGTGEANFLAGVANIYDVQGFNPELAQQQFFTTYTKSGYINDLEPFPGVIGLIQRVKQLGLKVAVASSADICKVNTNLKAIGISKETFDFVASGSDIVNKKPAPDVFLAAAKGVGVIPERCIVVEDAVAGVQAAKTAGMRCIAVSTSLEANSLDAAGADVVRDEPGMIEIFDLFGKDVFAEAGEQLEA